MIHNIIWFKNCSYNNKNLVGGKCSSLGELYHLAKKYDFAIADGFAITTNLYDEFIKYNNLSEIVCDIISNINANNIEELDAKSKSLKNLIYNSFFSKEHEQLIIDNYIELSKLYNVDCIEVAVRSSALAEDLPNASFAGQHDTYLNINSINELLDSIKKCYASLFNSRAISYRQTHYIELSQVKISVAIQKMVRSDLGSAGVAFSIDPETGYNKAIIINSAFGLGELVVSGGVKPDEFIIDKRVLNLLMDLDSNSNSNLNLNSVLDPIIAEKMGDKLNKIVYDDVSGIKHIITSDEEFKSYSLSQNQIINLAKTVMNLEQSYSVLLNQDIGSVCKDIGSVGIDIGSVGIDIEWALDGIDGLIYIIQARPETIHSTTSSLEISKYILNSTVNNVLLKGISVGEKISTGKIKNLKSMDEYKLFNHGDILVTDMTTPDWEPLMKISSGIITNKGGRTCHAAIVARELGLNAIVGTGTATEKLYDDLEVTINCSDGEEAQVIEGIKDFYIEKISVNNNLVLPVKLMLNVGNPENSFTSSMLPNSGVGLARLEFIISNYIKIHPQALYDYPSIPLITKNKIDDIIGINMDAKKYFIEKLAKGISKIASSFYPKDVIVRLSDFKSNEYKNLIGGDIYEPDEENPMIGWRGASRYYSQEYENAFSLECYAIKYARETMCMTNVIVMIPFCRTPKECAKVLKTMGKYGLVRGVNGLQVYLMCEIPSNVIEADNFSPLIDGVSIGGNDLLQLTLGVDRDSEKITHLSDNENISYRRMISMGISTYRSNNIKVGFCGQQPSDSIEFCNFLIEQSIDSISVTPDSVLKAIKNLGV